MTRTQDVSPRRIERRRRLPGGRAVVGALLVTVAALAVFAAYLDALGDPSTRFIVAREDIPAGTMVTDADRADQLFAAAPLSLVDAVADRAFPVEELEALVGHTIVSPLATGELLQRGAVHEAARSPDRYLLSFAVPAADAVGGRLAPGEPVDILTTSRDSAGATTRYVVRGVPVVAVDAGSGASVTVTVALDHDVDAQALGHAVQTAGVFLVSALGGDPDADTPAPYSEPLPGGSGETDGVGSGPSADPPSSTQEETTGASDG